MHSNRSDSLPKIGIFHLLSDTYSRRCGLYIFAKDHYSEFVFQLSVELENSEAATFRQLNKKDLKTSPKKLFFLMARCGSDFKDKMQAAI